MGTNDGDGTVASGSEEVVNPDEERRKWPRFLDKKNTNIWFSTPNGITRCGTVNDVSLGGIAIVICDPGGLKIGQSVVIGAKDCLISARIRAIVQISDYSFRVSLKWKHPESDAANDMVEGCQSDE